MKTIKRVVLVVLLFNVFVLTSCFDLGDYMDEAQYYEYFDDVILFDNSFSIKHYGMIDFYSPSTVNDFACYNEFSEYCFLAIHVANSISIESFNIHLLAEERCTVQLAAYKSSMIPSIKENEETSEKEYENLPDRSNMLASGTISGNNAEWNSALLTFSKTGGLQFEKNDYILIVFSNPDESSEYPSFKLTNILLRGFI